MSQFKLKDKILRDHNQSFATNPNVLSRRFSNKTSWLHVLTSAWKNQPEPQAWSFLRTLLFSNWKRTCSCGEVPSCKKFQQNVKRTLSKRQDCACSPSAHVWGKVRGWRGFGTGGRSGDWERVEGQEGLPQRRLEPRGTTSRSYSLSVWRLSWCNLDRRVPVSSEPPPRYAVSKAKLVTNWPDKNNSICRFTAQIYIISWVKAFSSRQNVHGSSLSMSQALVIFCRFPTKVHCVRPHFLLILENKAQQNVLSNKPGGATVCIVNHRRKPRVEAKVTNRICHDCLRISDHGLNAVW